MIAMGTFSLLSGGVNIISSFWVIALGRLWLSATASHGSLKRHFDELALLHDEDGRGCCRNCCTLRCAGTFDNIRGLAITAIVWGLFELVAYVVAFSIVGASYANGNSISPYSASPKYIVTSTYLFSCYAGSNDYCYLNYNPSFLYSSYSFYCYAGSSSYCYANLPDTIAPDLASYDTVAALGRWLLYASGHTAVAAPLSIAWGALSLILIGVLTVSAKAAEVQSAEGALVELKIRSAASGKNEYSPI